MSFEGSGGMRDPRELGRNNIVYRLKDHVKEL